MGPEGRDLAARGKTQTVQSGVAEPIQRLRFGRLRFRVGDRVGAFRQVIEFLESLPLGDHQLSCPPQEFQRGLGGMPVPPPARLPAILVLQKVAGPYGAVLFDMITDLVQLVAIGLALPVAPTLCQPLAGPVEGQVPIAVKFRRNDRRIMGPVLKKRPILFDQPVQRLGPVGSPRNIETNKTVKRGDVNISPVTSCKGREASAKINNNIPT